MSPRNLRSTEVFYHPRRTFLATFSKHRTLVLATQTSPPLPVASDQRLWQATHYRQHPNIGFSPLLKELVFIDPDSRIANENTAA